MPDPSSAQDPRPRVGRKFAWVSWGLAAVLAVLLVGGLRFEGRRWWCACGGWRPWSVGIHSAHTSQHLVDPYSLTHVLHGILLYALLRWVAGRLPRSKRVLLALALEGLWELVENSAVVIEKYRQGTVAQGYEGDSVVNSVGDLLSCGLGFLLAGSLPVWGSVALFLVVDVSLLILYRDNLALNMIMLVHPFQAIRDWQMGR